MALVSTNYGALVPEDELLTHQIVDTFATVSQSDPSWTEKIWTIAHARDNSLQVVLGRRGGADGSERALGGARLDHRGPEPSQQPRCHLARGVSADPADREAAQRAMAQAHQLNRSPLPARVSRSRRLRGRGPARRRRSDPC